MGQPHSAPEGKVHEKIHKDETTATLNELQDSGDANNSDNDAKEGEASLNKSYLATPSDWVLVDIESLTIIRSVYAAEMVVGGGRYLVVSARGLAMKEVNPAQMGKTMMRAWERIKADLVLTILMSTDDTAGSDTISDELDSVDPAVNTELFGGCLASSSDTTERDDLEESLPTPDISDQGSEADKEIIP
ncbi:hypothetical protein GP486_001580 [Trichoglossum hirsutum]|uniref:Uncharacterized protein n=1 Tax=Trichoglossum hirsutum TaxID=265104 RepID=A0A9P8LGS4_9PEZI|nr:hypothetical protein GP486_001580 [Trichoglossum hirsutum]